MGAFDGLGAGGLGTGFGSSALNTAPAPNLPGLGGGGGAAAAEVSLLGQLSTVPGLAQPPNSQLSSQLQSLLAGSNSGAAEAGATPRQGGKKEGGGGGERSGGSGGERDGNKNANNNRGGGGKKRGGGHRGGKGLGEAKPAQAK